MNKRTKGVKRAREEEGRKLQKGGWRRSGRKMEKKINK
jgi:hypothetical protein